MSHAATPNEGAADRTYKRDTSHTVMYFTSGSVPQYGIDIISIN